ncbi:unnamed protein product, partial [marine sediment metagenome]
MPQIASQPVWERTLDKAYANTGPDYPTRAR